MRWKAATIVVVVFAVIGCSNAAEPSGGGFEVVLLVTQHGDTIAAWTLDRLAAELPLAEVEIDGQVQRGHLLLDLLEASGAGDWQRAEVIGKGEGRAFDVVLEVNAAEVDTTWILDITNLGTLKLAADALPKEQWVRDVSEIAVE